jgi:hypothetical protein
MDARIIRAAILAAALLSLGASYRTQNFLVTAPTAEFAEKVAVSAEEYRRNLAVEWLGDELPPWGEVCPISVQVGPQLGAGGATSFMFIGGRPTGWTMTIQGSPERVLDSVLPHEVTHTIFATYFGRPLPRWADEGACTTVEHASERDKQHRLLYEFLSTGRGIAFNQMFAMKEYPPDVLPLYSQGYSLARFLIAQGGKPKFVEYVGDGMKWNNWTKATQHHYGFSSLSELQVTWVDWVRRGSPALNGIASQPGIQLASATRSQPQPSAEISRSRDVAMNVSGSRPDQNPLASTAGTSSSWYARIRDESRNDRIGSPPQAKPARSLHQAVGQALASQSGPTPESTPPAQLVTRPQPPERAQQRIIEWTQPHHPSAP